MLELKHKTRGNSSPQGKPKVYFTCHPDDYDKYFDDTTEEILGIHNCAIYYYLPGDNPGKTEKQRQLEDMQLIVVPVTSNFLFKKNDAREIDFLYAIEKHIPILPLLMEKNLVESFNAICGDKQFLNKFDTDPTAISYKEKLEKFINSVLVDDETAKEIRDAFWAYIFLSYRKKDRKYARELMELVHSNEKYKDVAIWYDEYLTPGEDFNEEISDALIKSAVFMLLVTPNLLEVPNYVMKDEYPAAVKFNKNILPAEAVETDREELEVKFTEIPQCIKASDEEEVFARLEKFVEKKPIIADPRHQYLMGMAYLSGTDVEVSYPRALEFLMNSANENYMPAIKRLVTMYHDGIGVKQDYNKSLEWQKILVKALRKDFDVCPGSDTADELWNATVDLVICYKDTNNHSCGIGEGFNLLKDEEVLSFVEQLRVAKLNHLIGVLYLDCNDSDNAKQSFKKALEIVRGLYDKEPELYEKELADINNAIGSFYAMSNDPVKAITYLKYFKDVYEKLKNRGEKDIDYVLALSYENLALAYHKSSGGNSELLKLSEEYHLKAIDIRLQLTEENPELWAEDLATSYINLGALYYDCDWVFSKDREPEEYIKAEEILEDIYKDDEIRRSKLVSVYQGKASWYFKSEKYELFKNISVELIDIQKKLAQKNAEAFCWQLVDSYVWLGRVYLKEGKKYDAEIMFEKGIKAGSIYKSSTLGVTEVMIGECYRGLAKVYKTTGRLKKARWAETKAKNFTPRKW